MLQSMGSQRVEHDLHIEICISINVSIVTIYNNIVVYIYKCVNSYYLFFPWEELYLTGHKIYVPL